MKRFFCNALLEASLFIDNNVGGAILHTIPTPLEILLCFLPDNHYFYVQYSKPLVGTLNFLLIAPALSISKKYQYLSRHALLGKGISFP